MDTLARDVGHYETEVVVIQRKEIVVIPPHLTRRTGIGSKLKPGDVGELGR